LRIFRKKAQRKGRQFSPNEIQGNESKKEVISPESNEEQQVIFNNETYNKDLNAENLTDFLMEQLFEELWTGNNLIYLFYSFLF
jgi:hypothetical protein